MGHHIQGIVLSRATAEHLRAELPDVLLAPLRQGFVLVPLTNRLFDLVRDRHPELEGSADEVLWKLSSSMEHVLRNLSRKDPVAYIETDYFGGAGDQAATAWADGRVMVSPRRDRRGPINDALRAIGVRLVGGGDEFDSVGLIQYRQMDDWECEEST